ncbi:MAG: hypothetical protein IPM63_16095 [Acidobacteriota bacterium]|nr:MAG: hypothetical protein IPM63_16095 [Acidobacteriota bacterium]
MSVFVRALGVWALIILAESVHGTLRTLFLEPAMGGPQARRLSVLTGALLIFLVTFLFVRWVGARSPGRLLIVGTMWVLLTVAFELLLGRLLLDLSWERIFEDYDLRKGGLMAIGLVFMLFAPLIAARSRGIR